MTAGPFRDDAEIRDRSGNVLASAKVNAWPVRGDPASAGQVYRWSGLVPASTAVRTALEEKQNRLLVFTGSGDTFRIDTATRRSMLGFYELELVRSRADG